jgi:hypothetical protein
MRDIVSNRSQNFIQTNPEATEFHRRKSKKEKSEEMSMKRRREYILKRRRERRNIHKPVIT